MTRNDERTTETAVRGTTRREVVKLGGGTALAGLAFAGLSGRLMAAQEASPVAGETLEGTYVVIRLRKLNPDRNPDELNALIRDGFVPQLQAIPGFVSAFFVADEVNGDQFSVGVYADKAGADESTRIAQEWGTESGALDYVVGDPVIVEGVIDVAGVGA